jgi:hypothetical protein
MSFIKKLFGKSEEISKAGSLQKSQQDTVNTYYEKDNRGTRHDTHLIASGYWLTRLGSRKSDPYLLYEFNTENAASNALLELSCIHKAVDSGKLICSEVLIFGCYQSENGKFEAVLCGGDLSHDLWKQAKSSFIKHGGIKKESGELEPKAQTASKQSNKTPHPEKVVLVKEYEKNGNFYRILSGPDGETAQAYLANNPVTRRYYYVIVETPEGNYGRDIDGMYKE